MKTRVCIVTPTFQEAQNIVPLVEELYSISKQTGLSLGVIVVDDNSPDGTANLVRGLCSRYENIELIQRQSKSGLGSAVRDGMARALSSSDCQAIVTMDADFSHDPKDIPRLIEAGGDLVVGSRYVRGGKIKGWGLGRKMISWGANTACHIMLKTGVRDNTANFRLYSRDCALACLGVAEGDFEWIVSSLVLARKRGFRAREIPVTFVNRKKGESKLRLRHIFRWFKFLLRSLASSRRFAWD